MKHRVIAFTGKQRAGTGAAADIVRSLYNKSGKRVRITKFAQPMYDIQNYIYERTLQTPPIEKDRKLLQWIGTEWGRSKDVNLWANIWQLDVKNDLMFSRADVVIVDDCKFDNETTKIKELGGIVIRIESERSEREKRGAIEGEAHASEQGVSDSNIVATVYNNGSLEDLEKNLEYLLTTLNAL